MSETSQHNTIEPDQSLGIINKLAMLELSKLTYVQLIRLQRALHHASDDIKKESARRAKADASDDTVEVRSPDKGE